MINKGRERRGTLTFFGELAQSLQLYGHTDATRARTRRKCKRLIRKLTNRKAIHFVRTRFYHTCKGLIVLFAYVCREPTIAFRSNYSAWSGEESGGK